MSSQTFQITEAKLSSTKNTSTGDESPVGAFKAALAKQQQDNEILAWCNRQYDLCKTQRVDIERKWYIYMAYYFGRHYVRLVKSAATTNGFQLKIPAAPPWRVRLTINRVRLAIRKQVSTLCQQKPRFYSVPASTSDEDLMSCRVAEGILDAHYREEDIATKTRRFVFWGSVCGTSFVKTYWDKYGKDSNGNTGKICTEVISPFYIYVPDLLQPDIELQPYVIHVTTMSPEMAKAKYNLDIAPNVTAVDNVLEDQFLNLLNAQKPPKKNQVLNLEFWIKPGIFRKFPKGALVTICGDQVVQFKEGMPYEHGQFPFVKHTDIDTGAFYGESPIADIAPLNRELNRTRSQIVEAKNLMAKPKLLAARGSVNASQITSEPGQVIYYTPGFTPPQPMAISPLPNYVFEEVTRLQTDIEDLSGQHDISGLLGTRTAATALSYVQNADALITASASLSIESCIQKVGRHVVSLVRQYWDQPRLVKVVGIDDSFEAQMWRGADITDHTDVYIETGSALPQDRSARQAFLMDLLKLGAIQPQQLLEMLDIGGIEKVYEDYLIDKRQAQRENLQMIKFAQEAQQSSGPDPELIMQALGLLNVPTNTGAGSEPSSIIQPPTPFSTNSTTIPITRVRPAPTASTITGIPR